MLVNQNNFKIMKITIIYQTYQQAKGNRNDHSQSYLNVYAIIFNYSVISKDMKTSILLSVSK